MAVRSETKTITKRRGPEEPAERTVRTGQETGKRTIPPPGGQTKESYATYEEAEAAGLVIKKRHPIVQVAVYDALKGVRKIIELPQN